MGAATWTVATASIVTALGAIASAYYARKAIGQQQANFDRQIRDYQLTLHAKTILRFEQRFNDPDFKQIRCLAANALLAKQDEEQAEDVFDFFETVGLFVKLGALTEEIAYSVFFHWVNLYWKAGKHHIGSKQQESAALWGDFERLYNSLCNIEKRTHADSDDLTMSESRLRHQLQEEAELCSGAEAKVSSSSAKR